MGIIKLQSGGVLSQPLAKQQFKSIYGREPSGASDYVKVADIQSNPSKYGMKAGILPSIEITAKSEVEPTIIGKHYAAQKEANRQHNFIPSNKGLVPNPDAKRGIEQSDIDLALIGGGLTGRVVKMVQGLLPKATTKLGKVAVGLGKEGIEEVGSMVNPLSGVFNPEIKDYGSSTAMFKDFLQQAKNQGIAVDRDSKLYKQIQDEVGGAKEYYKDLDMADNEIADALYLSTKTKQAQEGLKDSKVQDMVYHGSPNTTIDVFEPSVATKGKGVYVSNSKDVADIFKQDGKVYPLVTSLVKLLNWENLNDTAGNIQSHPNIADILKSKLLRRIQSKADNSDATFNPFNGESELEYTIKNPTQLKSLFRQHLGKWDWGNPNIHKAVAPVGLGLGYGLSQTEKKRSGGILKFQQSGVISKDTASAHFRNLYGRFPSGAGDAVRLQQIIQNPSKFGIKQNVLPGVEVSATSLKEPGITERYFAAQKGKLKSNEMVGGKANPTANKMEPVDWEMALMPSRGLSKVLLSNMAKSRIARIAVEGIDMIDPTSMGMGLAKAAKQYEVKPIKGVASMGFPFEIRKKVDNQLALPNPNNRFNPEIKEYKDNYEMFKDFNEQGRKQGIVIDRDSDEYQDYLANAHKSREYYVARDIDMLRPRVEAGAGSYRNIGREGLKPYNLEDPLDAKSLGFLHGERLDDWKNRQLALAYKQYTPEWLGRKIDQASIDKGLGIDNPSEGFLKHLEEGLSMKPRLHKDLKSLSTEREKLINDSPSVSYDDRIALSSSGNPEDISLLNHIDDASRSKEARLNQLKANEAMIKSSSLLTKLGIKENPYKEYLKGSKQVGDWVSPSNRLSNEDIADGLWLSRKALTTGDKQVNVIPSNYGISENTEYLRGKGKPIGKLPLEWENPLKSNIPAKSNLADMIREWDEKVEELNQDPVLKAEMMRYKWYDTDSVEAIARNRRSQWADTYYPQYSIRNSNYTPDKVSLDTTGWKKGDNTFNPITKSMNREHLGKWDLSNPDWHKAMLPMGLGLGYKSLNKEDK